MGVKEKKIIENRLSSMPKNKRLFRINAGMGWAGKLISNSNGRVVLKNARPFHGAPAGWPDLSGWTTIEITQDMVGKTAAIFTGEEIKTTGVQSHEQKIFSSVLVQMGGFYELILD